MIVGPEVVGEFASGSHEAFHKVHHFDSYLFMLTKYTVFNYITTKNVSRFTSEDNIPEISDGCTPHDELIAKDLQLLIDMVVSEMPPKRKMIYQLSRIEGLSNEQIAEKLGIQKKTVENHLNIALNELRDALALSILVYLILPV